MLCCFLRRGQPHQHNLVQLEEQNTSQVASSRCLAPEGSVPLRLFRDLSWKAGSEAPQDRNDDESQVVLQEQDNSKPAPAAPLLTSGAMHRPRIQSQDEDKQHKEGAAADLKGDEQDLDTRAQQKEERLIEQRLLPEPPRQLAPAEYMTKGSGLQTEKALPDGRKEAAAAPTGEKDKGKAPERDGVLNKREASTSDCNSFRSAHSSLPGSKMSPPLLVGTPSSSLPNPEQSDNIDKLAAVNIKEVSVGPTRKQDKGKAPETASEVQPSGGLLISSNSSSKQTVPLESPLSKTLSPVPLLAVEHIPPGLVSDPESSDNDGSTTGRQEGIENETREGGQDGACPRVDREGENVVNQLKDPVLRHLLKQMESLRDQLLARSGNERWQRVLARVEAMSELVLKNGSAMGADDVEALQSEMQAVDLFLKMEQEEAAAEDLDRQLSTSLQEAYDKELAAHLAAQLQAQQDTTVECSICFEEFPSKDCVKAHVKVRLTPQKEQAQGSAASDGDEPAPCSHWHCVDCVRQYASVKVLESRTARIPCTAKGCPGFFAFEDLEWMLGEKERDVYTQLLAEDTIAVKVYCPFDGCSAVMECAEGERGPDSLCPVCKRVFCRDCRVAWHQGQTCAQYASAKQDGPLHALAKKNKWKPCPKCQHMIERQDGCNFMQCKCGCGFCYKCGAAYTDRTPIAGNNHGTPGCKCSLLNPVRR